jgi:hypothetical protein
VGGCAPPFLGLASVSSPEQQPPLFSFIGYSQLFVLCYDIY